jgi:hypothetical protein
MKFFLKIAGRMIRGAGWLIDSFLWIVFRAFHHYRANKRSGLILTIGVTTFLNRYERFFKPLLKKLVFLFPESRIIVIANGSVMKERQTAYLEEIRSFCGRFSNVELTGYDEPAGLSHLWNMVMLGSTGHKVLMLNDDLKIMLGFRKFIEHSGITGESIATINSSWSHFLLSGETYSRVGPFDEGLKEVGGEDDDYLARMAMLGIRPADYKTGTVTRKGRKKRQAGEMNSYGKIMSEESGGYSTANTEYLHGKWEVSDSHFEGCVEIPRQKMKYWKLREEGR